MALWSSDGPILSFAAVIVMYRFAHGDFDRIDDFNYVRGKAKIPWAVGHKRPECFFIDSHSSLILRAVSQQHEIKSFNHNFDKIGCFDAV